MASRRDKEKSKSSAREREKREKLKNDIQDIVREITQVQRSKATGKSAKKAAAAVAKDSDDNEVGFVGAEAVPTTQNQQKVSADDKDPVASQEQATGSVELESPEAAEAPQERSRGDGRAGDVDGDEDEADGTSEDHGHQGHYETSTEGEGDSQLTEVVDEVRRQLRAAMEAADDTDEEEMWLEADIQPIGEDEWLDACNSLVELDTSPSQPGNPTVDDLISFDLDDSLKHTFQQQLLDNSVQDVNNKSQDTITSSTSAGDLHVGESVTSKRSSKWDDLPRRDRIPRSCKVMPPTVEEPESPTQDTPLVDVTDDAPQTPASRARVSSWHGTPTQLSPTSAPLTQSLIGSLQSADVQPQALEVTPLTVTQSTYTRMSVTTSPGVNGSPASDTNIQQPAVSPAAHSSDAGSTVSHPSKANTPPPQKDASGQSPSYLYPISHKLQGPATGVSIPMTNQTSIPNDLALLLRHMLCVGSFLPGMGATGAGPLPRQYVPGEALTKQSYPILPDLLNPPPQTQGLSPGQTNGWVCPVTGSGTSNTTSTTSTPPTTVPPALASARKNLKLTPYEEKMNPVQWWGQYKTYAEVHNYSPEDRRTYLQFFLGENPKNWYHRAGIQSLDVKYDKDKGEEDPLRKAFLDQFGTNGPDKYQFRNKLYTMRQGTDTCLEFVEKVLDTARNLHQCEGGKVLDTTQFEEAKAVIMGGLNDRAHDHMVSTNPQNTEELVKEAKTASYLESSKREMEHIVAIRQELHELKSIKDDVNEIKRSATNMANGNNRQSSQPKKKQEPKLGMNDLICTLQSFSHAAFESGKNAANANQNQSSDISCFKCGKKGHMARRCPLILPRGGQSLPPGRRPLRPQATPYVPVANREQNDQNRAPRQRQRGDRLPVCQWCHRVGHTVQDCWTAQAAAQNQNMQGQQPVHNGRRQANNQ